jgi:hypothetical protein
MLKVKAGPTEAAFTAQVIGYARLMGWRSAHFRPGMNARGQWMTAVQGDGAGFPDLILARGPRLVVAELKVGRNKPTAEQKKWLAAFEAAGVPAYTWRPADWPEIEDVLSVQMKAVTK